MATKPKNPEAIAAGERLIRAREALGFPQRRRFASVTDVPESRLQKWESGTAMVSTAYVAKLQEMYGVDHNWIYGGVIRGLPHEIALKLVEQTPEEEPVS